MRDSRGPQRRVTALWVATALVLITGLSGAHVHDVGHARASDPVLTAPAASHSIGFDCLSCKLTNSPLEQVSASATLDRVEASDDDLLPVHSILLASSLRTSGCTRAPPSLL